MALIPQIIITTLLVAICSSVHSADLMTLSEEQWFLLNVVTELIPPIIKGVQPAIQEIIHITIENSKDALNLASELIDNPNN